MPSTYRFLSQEHRVSPQHNEACRICIIYHLFFTNLWCRCGRIFHTLRGFVTVSRESSSSPSVFVSHFATSFALCSTVFCTCIQTRTHAHTHRQAKMYSIPTYVESLTPINEGIDGIFCQTDRCRKHCSFFHPTTYGGMRCRHVSPVYCSRAS